MLFFAKRSLGMLYVVEPLVYPVTAEPRAGIVAADEFIAVDYMTFDCCLIFSAEPIEPAELENATFCN